MPHPRRDVAAGCHTHLCRSHLRLSSHASLYPSPDSNREPSAPEADASASWARGACVLPQGVTCALRPPTSIGRYRVHANPPLTPGPEPAPTPPAKGRSAGVEDGIRTRGLLVGNETRYQLRYIHIGNPCLPARCTFACPARRGHRRPLHGRRGAGTDGSAFRSRSGWSPTTVEPPSGVEPETFSLPRKRSATELWRQHPKVGESPKPDSNRRPSAYKADALAGLSYQGVVVVILERGHSVEHAPRTPPAKTTATRAINSAQWNSRCCPGRIRTSTDLIQNQESCR